MKHIIFCAVCITMLLLTACGRASNQANQSTDNTSVISSHDNEALTNQAVQTTDHVLTILARSTYAGPIHQAEQALIAEWAQRPEKEGHTFRVELTTFHPNDELNQLTRLDTMLMAGQAYDIFFPVADHRHIREYVLSGFVTDIYPLMDNCSFTNRNDFFTTALEAWEIDDGLYVFPWDFSFNYAFINSALPQELVGRFNQFDTITVADLVDIYNELLHSHGHEFDHFNFSHGSTLHHPSRVVAMYMNNYVDFENNIASLTEDTFVTFLTDFVSIFDEQSLHGQEREYWRNGWINGDIFEITRPAFHIHALRMIAVGANSFTWGIGWHSQWQWDSMMNVTMQPHAFIVESREWFPAAAILPQNVFEWYFEPGILLVDGQGNLLIGENTTYPAGVAISAAANGTIAWEFARHLIHAFNRREMHGMDTLFYPHSFAIPIVRDLFDFRVRASVAGAFTHYINWFMFPDDGPIMPEDFVLWRDMSIDSVLPHIAALAERPMALTQPPIPDFLYVDNLELLLRGLITPQDFAQRTQNAVSLWLIGG